LSVSASTHACPVLESLQSNFF